MCMCNVPKQNLHSRLCVSTDTSSPSVRAHPSSFGPSRSSVKFYTSPFPKLALPVSLHSWTDPTVYPLGRPPLCADPDLPTGHLKVRLSRSFVGIVSGLRTFVGTDFFPSPVPPTVNVCPPTLSSTPVQPTQCPVRLTEHP